MPPTYYIHEIRYKSRCEKDAAMTVSASSSRSAADLLKKYLTKKGDKLVNVISDNRTEETSRIEGIIQDESEGDCATEGFSLH